MDILGTDTSGRTALHFAAMYGNIHTALYLIGRNLSILWVRDEGGQLALDVAKEQEDSDEIPMVQLLELSMKLDSKKMGLISFGGTVSEL